MPPTSDLHARRRRRHRWPTLALVLAATACADAAPAPAPFDVRAGVEQITVTGAQPHTPLTLLDAEGRRLVALRTDDLGQANFAYIPDQFLTLQTGPGATVPVAEGHTLKPGPGYTIVDESADPPARVGPIRVLARDDVPPASHYDRQVLHEGLNYITMRDGVQLSATIWYPDSTLWGEGPWPTVVNYSGYSPSNPNDPPPGVLIATMMLGYAGVGVNMRGTGCSGGVFDIFNPAQHADGYDIIEVVSRQWFARGGKVGMVGLSYPGISQLYVASTRPPGLAAIAPLSVIEDPWRQQWPGGVYNAGFTKNWLEERDRSAAPGGQSWTVEAIAGGDTTCAANQPLRQQNIDFEQFGRLLEFYNDDAEDRRLSNLVPAIDVPVFLTGAWQDEQTGSRFATMLDDFENAPVRRFTMFNGRHPDGYTPLALTRWAEFLEFYVAERIPLVNPLLRVLGPEIFRDIFGASGLDFEPDRFGDYTDFAAARRAYERQPDVRVLFESGAGSTVTEAPVHRFEASFAAWPPPARAGVWYLGPAGRLLDSPPAATEAGIDTYRHDPEAGPLSYVIEDDIFRLPTDWEPVTAPLALAYLSDPLPDDTVVVGNGGYVELWFASAATAAHVEVNVIETRPDGHEFLVQSGVFAARHRGGIDADRSQEFLVEYTYRQADAAPLAPDEFVELKVPIRPFAHAFRAGSRLRLEINTPGRDSPFWAYENPAYDGAVWHRVARTPAMASRLVLPLVDGVDVPPEHPPCPSLRGVICRPYLAVTNATE